MKKEVTNLNKKDELFKDLVKLFQTSRVDFSSTAVGSSGSYFVQVLTNALWYITNDHLTIHETTKQAKELTPILKLFEGYIGYYEIKRKKKVKVMPLSSDLLRSHAHALFPVVEALREVNWVMENNIRWDTRFGRLSKQLPRIS